VTGRALSNPVDENRRRANFVVDSLGSYDSARGQVHVILCRVARRHLRRALALPDEPVFLSATYVTERSRNMRIHCAHCKRPFIAERPTLARYCANRCRQAAYDQRLRWTGRRVMTAI